MSAFSALWRRDPSEYTIEEDLAVLDDEDELDNLSATSSERRALDRDIKEQIASIEKTLPLLTNILGSLLAGFCTLHLVSPNETWSSSVLLVIPRWLPIFKGWYTALFSRA